jgi:hypothetical protein
LPRPFPAAKTAAESPRRPVCMGRARQREVCVRASRPRRQACEAGEPKPLAGSVHDSPPVPLRAGTPNLPKTSGVVIIRQNL